MNKYLEISKITFKAQLAWRFDIAVNVVFTIAKILFAFILWRGIFDQRSFVAGFTFDSMLSYYIINSFLSQLDMSDKVSEELSSRIRGGTFSKYMVIPVNIQGYFLAQTAGASVFYLVFNLIAAVVWIFIFGIRFTFTGNPWLILAAVVFVLLGLIFMIQLNYFLGLLTLRFQDIFLFLMIKNNLVAFIAGTLVPLALLPELVLQVMRYFPFYYTSYLPSMLLIGRNGEEIGYGLITLTAWVLSFMVINKIAYERLRVRYDGVGI
ncbi:MAG: multidrug family transporter permease [Herbinix sp.]|jgi:ABC-2 type transport system permease protein|nr:multidrug family transporter permease [Herbinix sp.]